MTDYTRAEVEGMLAGTTPGPWKSHETDQGGAGQDAYVVVDDGTDRLARVMCYTQRGLNRKPYEANARLIAAAPDLARQLLAALDRVEALEGAVKRAEFGFSEAYHKFQDEDYEGPHERFTVPVVCHVKPYYDMHMKFLMGMWEEMHAALGGSHE